MVVASITMRTSCLSSVSARERDIHVYMYMCIPLCMCTIIGFQYMDTLTGFKWMGNTAYQLVITKHSDKQYKTPTTNNNTNAYVLVVV